MKIQKERWRKAQNVELNIWKSGTASSLDQLFPVLINPFKIEKFIQQYKSELEINFNTVLEIGIGPLGIGWVGIFPEGFIVGVDPLPLIKAETGRDEFDALISQLQQKVAYIRARGEELPFKDNTFDSVVCDNVLDHTENPDLLLQEAHRVIKLGGHLILGVNCFSIFGIVKWRFYATKRFANLPGIVAHPHSYLKQGVLKAVKKAGFEVHIQYRVPVWKQIMGHQYRFYLIAYKGLESGGGIN